MHGPVDGSPDVDDAIPALEQVWRFVPHVQLHTLFRGEGGLVDVCSQDGSAGRGGVGAADGVVEEEDALGAGDVVEE